MLKLSELEIQIGSNRSRLIRGDPVQNRDVRRQSARVAQQRHLAREVVCEQEGGPAPRLYPEPESNQIVRRQRIARESDVLDRIDIAVGQARDQIPVIRERLLVTEARVGGDL